ncbi:unnamed protein product [Heterobilharzia americana]|nr:unnamed protein product [Heterobilharzia americana]
MYIQAKSFSMFNCLYVLTVIMHSPLDQFKISSVHGQNILKYEPVFHRKPNELFENYSNNAGNHSSEVTNRSRVEHLALQHDFMKNSENSDWFENRIMRRVYNKRSSHEVGDQNSQETYKSQWNSNKISNANVNIQNSPLNGSRSSLNIGHRDEGLLNSGNYPEHSDDPLTYINMDKLLDRDKRQAQSVAHYILSPLLSNRKRTSSNYPSSSSSTLYGLNNSRREKSYKPSTSLKLKKSVNQPLLKYDTENNIFNFVFQFVRYNQTSMDIIAAFNLICEWESFKVMQQIQAQREQKLKKLRYKQEHRRLDEYHRYLRHFSTMLTNEKAKQFKNAQNFYDFKKLIIGNKDVKSRSKNNNDKNNSNNNSNKVEHNGNIIHSPLDFQSLAEHHKIHDSTSSLSLNDIQFSGGIGGGIFSDSLRLRKPNNRGGRAIISSDSRTNEQNSLKTNLGTEFSRVLTRNKKQLSKNTPTDEISADSERYNKEHAYSEEELRRAFDSYQEFKMVSCQPQNQTLCTEALLGLTYHNQQNQQQHHNTALIIPRGIHVQRCGQPENSRCNHYFNPFQNFEEEYEYEKSDLTSFSSAPPNSYTSYDDHYLDMLPDRNQHVSCDCETLEEECLPLKVSLRTYAVAVMQIAPFENFKHSTELLVLTNHLKCGCQPRCSNRLCIPPLKFIMHTFSDCACVCPPNDKRCFELLEGKRQFTAAEIPSPLNGSYILPPCRYGVMDDLHLYHRHCPGPVKNIIPAK